MKKLVSLALLFVMIVSMLASCGAPEYEEIIEEEENNVIGGGDIIGGWDDEDPDHNHGDDPTPGGDPDNGENNTDNPGDDPIVDPGTNPDLDDKEHTVYLLNSAGWEQIYIYYWGNRGEINGGWPGKELTIGDNYLYRDVIDTKYSQLIFNNDRGMQTPDLYMPNDDRIVYDNGRMCWITFDEAIELINSGYLQPHEHTFVDGKCECGETDPDYTEPHDHLFINGKCECGESEPHTHTFIEGKCECGETDPNYKEEGCDHPTYNVSITKSPTCTEKGEKTYTCDNCDYSYKTSISATGHTNLVTIFGNDATCGADGLTDGQKCNDCGTITIQQTTIKATGNHNYSGEKCSVCGMAKPNFDDEMELFNALFDETSHVSIKLDISNAQLKKMQKDFEACYKSPIYRMADLIVTIRTADGRTGTWTIPQVGVRMKGNTSRTNFYSDNNGMYNLIHFKISFQETFDEVEYYGNDALTWNDPNARKERKNRTFATLEKIDMRWNRNDDTTYIRENYAYALYREFGVLAPHTNLASIDIGKDHAGVFVIYEPVDKIFLEKNLPEEALGGDLYKLGWTSEGATFTNFTSYGVEDELANKFYVYDLKTNKKTSDHSSLKNLINTIKSSSVSKDTFASLIDIDNLIYYSAVSYYIGNPDDLRNNYNNTYIYFRPDTGKMLLIPYDMDRGFGINTWNPYGNSQTKDSPYSKTNVCGEQRNPIFLRSVCQGGMFLLEYKEALIAVDASEMLTKARFEESFNIAKNLYGNETKPSKSYDNANWCRFKFDNKTCSGASGGNNMSFGNYLDAKRATLYSYIGDQGHTDTSGSSSGGNSGSDSGDNGNNGYDPITDARPYIRGEHNNWLNDGVDWNPHEMKENADGTFSYTLTTDHVGGSGRIKFKIFDSSNNMWYGYEIVDPNCQVNYNDTTNGNGNKNFYLAPGTYELTFDPTTVTLYIVKK